MEVGTDDGSTEEEDPVKEELIPDSQYTKTMSKHQKSNMGHHVSELKQAHWHTHRSKLSRKTSSKQAIPSNQQQQKPSRAQRFSVMEVFTWTCMVSMLAAERGWKVWEPVTLPGWDLKCRRRGKNLQNINYITAEEDILGSLRQEERPLLGFVKAAVRRQRSRGKAVLGENPKTSRSFRRTSSREGTYVPFWPQEARRKEDVPQEATPAYRTRRDPEEGLQEVPRRAQPRPGFRSGEARG